MSKKYIIFGIGRWDISSYSDNIFMVDSYALSYNCNRIVVDMTMDMDPTR